MGRGRATDIKKKNGMEHPSEPHERDSAKLVGGTIERPSRRSVKEDGVIEFDGGTGIQAEMVRACHGLWLG